MSEWDNEVTGLPGKDKREKNNYAGKLNIPMTIACFLAVTAVSFIVAWLMRDTARSFWEMGLTFAAPFAALMCSAMLVERSTGRMTPQCSRNAQMICVLATIATAFSIGCLAEVLHQPVIIENAEPEYDYLIVQDKSGSMLSEELDTSSEEALHELIDQMEDVNNVGIVAFGSKVIEKQEILPLDSQQREKILKIVDIPISTWNKRDPKTSQISTYGDGTNFTNAMKGAMGLIEKMENRTRPMRIILVTDGDDQANGDFKDFNKWASQINTDTTKEKIELCAIQLGKTPMLSMVKEAVKLTGGIDEKARTDELASILLNMKSTLIIPEPVDTLKATYEGRTSDGKPNTPYMILTCVLLIMQGLLCGFALKIMFSVQGQFRFQTILSPLMGLAAFLILNFGRFAGIAPAWICEGAAFSVLGSVFMRENLNTGRHIPDVKKTGEKKNASAKPAEAFDEDF